MEARPHNTSEQASEARQPPATPYRIRPFHRDDRKAVRRICASCAWLGRPDSTHTLDADIWAEFWTRYFTDCEPQHTWVVEHGDSVVGYLTGTTNAACVDRYLPRLIPSIVWRAARARLLRRPERRALVHGMLASLARGELAVPPEVRRAAPATFHVNLLAEARARGLGTSLIRTCLDRMRRLGVPGVHVQIMSHNAAAIRCAERLGFRPAGVRRLTAYARVDPQPIDVHTLALVL
ncbi:MAG: N-acetyltransferase family protein [Planctomycetota bacterium]